MNAPLPRDCADVLAVMKNLHCDLVMQNGPAAFGSADEFAKVRAAVAEVYAQRDALVEALQEIHYFSREGRRLEADRVRWLAERAERAIREAGAEPKSLAALARSGGAR